MRWILDGICIGMVLFFAFAAYRNGFLCTVTKFLGTLGAFFLSMTYSKPIATAIYRQFLALPLRNLAIERVEAIRQAGMGGSAEKLATAMPEMLRGFFTPERAAEMEQWYQKIFADEVITVVDQLLTTVVAPAAIGLLRMAVLSIGFLLLVLLVNLLARLLRGVNWIPLIGTLNEWFGGLLGGVQGILYLFVGTVLLRLVLTAAGGDIGSLNETVIAETLLFRQLYAMTGWIFLP